MTTDIGTSPHPSGSARATAIPPTFLPFLVAGAIAVTAGGLAAAATGPTSWDRGSWVAAFLVLVGGVGQIGLGIGQLTLTDIGPSVGRVTAEVASLNAGVALVIIGTLLSAPAAVTVGALILAGGLVLFAHTARGQDDRPSWARRSYNGLLVVLIASTPIGLALTWTRP